ncbi:MAG TPA: carboxypeptidase-like regulatory domain-containing protein [Bryobacteraceae bacterium]|nr:carboxypeptidase-like regulatory domain-containing protein [Bryobacteraceae bacterium]
MLLHARLLALLTVCAFIVSNCVYAQTITASITGTVTDPSGAVVPNVKITATNADTNVNYSATTNQDGVYNLLFLAVGRYNVAAENSGFKKSVLGPFPLEVNQIARVDVKLEVGDTTQSVEISDFAPILQTESTATGDALTSTRLSSLPLNGRNFASLTQLIPGAISTSPNAMNTSGRIQGSGSRPQVNGNREQTNNFLLDGIDSNDSIDNRIGYQPNVDALEEVKVITGNGSSEFGNVGGAIVNATLKSGTNAYHGNVFEFLRNDKLDANTYFNNQGGIAKRAFRRNIFGGTFGGPVKKSKIFFFLDYEGTLQRDSGPATASVAPDTWRTGNLSDLLTKSAIYIRDPNTNAPCSAANLAGCFAGNLIPQSRIVNPVAAKLFSSPDLYPLPNITGTGTLGVSNNYAANSANTLNNHQADVKGDFRPNDKDSVMLRWSISRYEQYGSAAALPVFMTTGNFAPTLSAVAAWTRAFSPSVVNEVRLGYTRIGIDEGLPVDWSGKLGANGNASFGIGGGQPYAGLSSVSLGNGLSAVGTGAAVGSTVDNKLSYGDNLTWQRGKHLLKMGGQFIRFRQNRYYAGNNGALGSFTFDGTMGTGQAYSDFLLNRLSTKGRGAVVGKWGQRHWLDAFFIQDDFKLLPNLTVNLGMRWEYSQPLYEVADREANIDLARGVVLLAGQDGNSRALYNAYYKQFEPRVGMALAVSNKTVLRVGYAISSFMEGTGANLRLPLNPPFFVETNVNYDVSAPGNIGIGFADAPNTGSLSGPRTTPTANPFYQGRAWDPNLRPQFTHQYNASFEYRLTPTSSITTAYVGQLGTHLVIPHEGNNPVAGTGPVSTWINANDRRPLFSTLPNVGNVALTEGSARMSYNALQISGRKRLSGGLELTGFYVWSKSVMEGLGYYGCGSVNAEGAYWQDAYNRRGNRGLSCFDAKSNASIGGLYNLPFGKGQKFGSSWSKPMDLLLGGWNVNYFLTDHSGFPVTVFASAANSGGRTPRGNLRANAYLPFGNTGASTTDAFFGPVTAASFCGAGVNNGTCAFGLPADGTLGSVGVGTLRAPSFFNLDMSVGKKFLVTEKQYVDFRMEMFNGLNHASWGPPGRDITSPATFGQITSQVQNPRNIQFGLKYYF